jgi:HEAT repeat protein
MREPLDGAQAARATVERLAHSAPGDRRPDALAALGALSRHHPDANVRELLLAEAERSDPAISVAAVEALAALHDPAAAPRLERLLGHATAATLRRAIVSTLGTLGASAATLLARLDEDPDAGVRAEAAWALGKLRASDAAVDAALNRASAASSEPLKLNAAAALKRRHAPRPAHSDFTAWHLLDYDGAPLADTPYRLALPDGLVKAGLTDPRGDVREEDVPAGTCRFDVP